MFRSRHSGPDQKDGADALALGAIRRHLLSALIAMPMVVLGASQGSAQEYKGSNQKPGSVGFWHQSLIGHFQIGWDERIYLYLRTPHKCGSGLAFYQPLAKGKQMILDVILAMESQGRPINIRIDSCEETGGGVSYGIFDKLEIVPR